MSYDRRFDGVGIRPAVAESPPGLVEMRERFAVRLRGDPSSEVAEKYNGPDKTGHGVTVIPETTSPTRTALSATSG